MENRNEVESKVQQLKKSNLRLKQIVVVMAFLCALFFIYALVQKTISEENLMQASAYATKASEESKKLEQCAEEARKLQQLAERAAMEAQHAMLRAEEELKNCRKK